MNIDQLGVGRYYAMRVPYTRTREVQVVQLRHFLSRATGNVLVQATAGEPRDSMIVKPSALLYEVIRRRDDAAWEPFDRALNDAKLTAALWRQDARP